MPHPTRRRHRSRLARPGPIYPKSSWQVGRTVRLTDALGQKRRPRDRSVTSALPPLIDILSVCRYVSKVPNSEIVASFDYLIGAAEQRLRNCKAEHLGGLKIDDHFDFGR